MLCTLKPVELKYLTPESLHQSVIKTLWGMISLAPVFLGDEFDKALKEVTLLIETNRQHDHSQNL